MNRKRLAMAACLGFALFLALDRGGTGMKLAQAQTSKTAYPNMAPLEQYLMPDRDAEIALARSAAPEAISSIPLRERAFMPARATRFTARPSSQSWA